MCASRKIKYGAIGFGGIAESRVAAEGFGRDKSRFDGHPAAVLVGATDVNPARRGPAEDMGLKWYESSEALLADGDIEAVYIATNNLSHASLAKEAMKKGKHVLVEKPIATTIDDAEELRDIARRESLSLGVDHMMVFNAHNRKAASLVGEGQIGVVNDIVMHMEFSFGSTAEEASSWRCSNPAELGGPVGDVGSHCMYMAEDLIGSKIHVLRSVYLPKVYDLEVEEGALVNYEFENGISGSARVSFNCSRGGLTGILRNLGYEIYGTEGVIRSYATLFQLSGHDDEPVGLRLELDDGKSVKDVSPDRVNNIYQGIISHHAQSILEDKPLKGDGGLHNLALILAAHKSAKKGGRRIEISQVVS